MRMKACVLLLPAAAALPARAHTAAAAAAPVAWSTEPWLWLLWLLPGLVVLAGIARLWRQAGMGAGVSRAQATAFAAGWLALGLALLSPLDALGQHLFWAHMAQHEVVMLIAAPLLVLGRPVGPLLWGLPAGWRPGAALLAQRLGLQAAVRVLGRPMAAWWLHAVVLWGWHAPALFQGALRERWLHDLQHVSFLGAALVFWWAVLQGRGGRAREALAILYLFTTLVHTSVLGALLTFGTRAWYPVYEATAPAWGLSALDDQQLGGLIMWVPGGVVYLLAALALCVSLLEGRAAARGRRWAPGGAP